MGNIKEVAGVLYIDDLSRLSRDVIDTLEFAKQLKFAEKQIIGVSDGFDLRNPMSNYALPLNAVQHSEFSRGLREKVMRGAKDSFERKRNTGAVPFGYKPIPVINENGQPEIRRNGTVETVVKVVPEEAASVVRMFELYTNEHKSPNQIAKIFNQELVGGRNSWNSTTIAGMLKNDRYRGLIVYNRTQTVQEPSTGRMLSRKRPESEWMKRQDESMRIISDDLWERAQDRRAQASRVFGNTAEERAASRQSVYSTRLFDMYCGYCNLPLRKNHSGAKTSSMICPSGSTGQYGCKLRSSKTLGIIEECILAHVKERLLNDLTIEQFVVDANLHLEAVASQPRPQVEDIDRKLKTVQEKLNRQVDRLSSLPDGPAADRMKLIISTTEVELLALREERKNAVTMNKAVEPLPVDFAKRALTDLRSLLNDDVVAAHQVLAKAVGQVMMTIGEKQGRTNIWIASFTLDLVPFLIEISTRGKIPTTHTLELLSVRGWNNPGEIKCYVLELKREMRIAQYVANSVAAGSSLNAVAKQLGTDHRTVCAALEFNRQWPDEARRYASDEAREQFKEAKYRRLAPEVGRLFETGMSIKEIAKHLLVSIPTVERAFDFWDSTAVQEAVAEGKRICRGDRGILAPEVYAEIQDRLKAGQAIRSIVREMKVDRSTVRRQKRLMEQKKSA